MRTLKSSGVPEDKCRVGASASACWLWLVALLHVRGSWSSCVFRAVQPFLLFGVMLSSQQGFRSLSSFHCVGLQHFGEREGLLAAAGSSKSGALRVLPMLQNGVSILGSRWGGCQPVLRSLCARSPSCGCFCLRLDFQVTVSVRWSQGSQPWILSACL